MQHIGVDIIEIARIERVIDSWGEQFLHRVYTDNELELCHNRLASLAARFSAKEAVIKVLGGMGRGFRWTEIEILSDARGKPVVHLHGSVQQQATDLGLNNLAISISDCEGYAVAFAVGEGK